MIPIQSVILIEELKDEEESPRVMRFGIVEKEDGEEEDTEE